MLSEDYGVAGASQNKYVYFTKGKANAPWEIQTGVGGFQVDQSAGSGPAIGAVDRDAQEDAITITWEKGQQGYIAFTSENPIDLFREMNGAMELEFDVRLDAPPAGNVTLSICSGAMACSNPLDIAGLLKSVPRGEWQRARISLSCFGGDGFDMRSVAAPFILSSTDEVQLSLSLVHVAEDDDGMETCGR
jgi:hypothetical protein